MNKKYLLLALFLVILLIGGIVAVGGFLNGVDDLALFS